MNRSCNFNGHPVGKIEQSWTWKKPQGETAAALIFVTVEQRKGKFMLGKGKGFK